MADNDFELPELPEQYDIQQTDTGLTLNLGAPGEGNDTDALAPRGVSEEDLVALAQVEAELTARWPETDIDPSLERIELLMDFLGEPQKSFKVIHVAGTNGKTSTVRMVESLLRSFGNRVGRTTSPHLQSVTERIGIDGEPIHPADFVRIYREIEPYIQMVDERTGVPMSYFEVMVGLAFAAFADARVAEIDTRQAGGGGEWDEGRALPRGIGHGDAVALARERQDGAALGGLVGDDAAGVAHVDQVVGVQPVELLDVDPVVAVAQREDRAGLQAARRIRRQHRMQAGRQAAEPVAVPQMVEQVHAEVVEPKIGDGHARADILQFDHFVLQPAQLLLAVGHVVVVGAVAQHVVVGRGHHVGNDHAVLHPLLEVDVLVQCDVGPEVDQLDAGVG